MDMGDKPENDDEASEIVASPGRITQETRDGPALSDRELDPPQMDRGYHFTTNTVSNGVNSTGRTSSGR